MAPGTWITTARHPGDDAPFVMDEVWWIYRPHWAKEQAFDRSGSILIRRVARQSITLRCSSSACRAAHPLAGELAGSSVRE